MYSFNMVSISLWHIKIISCPFYLIKPFGSNMGIYLIGFAAFVPQHRLDVTKLLTLSHNHRRHPILLILLLAIRR